LHRLSANYYGTKNEGFLSTECNREDIEHLGSLISCHVNFLHWFGGVRRTKFCKMSPRRGPKCSRQRSFQELPFDMECRIVMKNTSMHAEVDQRRPWETKLDGSHAKLPRHGKRSSQIERQDPQYGETPNIWRLRRQGRLRRPKKCSEMNSFNRVN